MRLIKSRVLGYVFDEDEQVTPVRKMRMGQVRMHVPANDNHPNRAVRMVAHNGGCSTTSGMVPVTLARSAASTIEQVAA